MKKDLKAVFVFESLDTPELRAKASAKARAYGLLGGTTAESVKLAELLQKDGVTQNFMEFYSQGLIGFYDYASNHYHVGSLRSMLEDFIKGKKIYFSNYR